MLDILLQVSLGHSATKYLTGFVFQANFSRANAFAFITFTNSSSRDRAIKEAVCCAQVC